MALPEVQVELYVNGKGPRHKFKTKLQGWDANRLDLEAIMEKYSLRALYAYSISDGRGQRLLLHPKNGLSMVCYSGKPESLIRLDSDPKTSLFKKALLMAVVVAVAVFVVLLFAEESDKPRWVKKLQETSGGGIGWLVGLVVIVVSQITGWPRSKRR